MAEEKRLSKMLIEHLCDADINCPFRMATPLFLVEGWAKEADKPVPQAAPPSSSIQFEYLQKIKNVI
jgi:hypothetical protein